MTDAASAVRELLRSRLLAGRNVDGGWGYAAGKATRLEPTCWALLALRDVDAAPLAAWPAPSGLLLERPGGEVNFAFHALALLALEARRTGHAAGNAALAAQLEAAKGIAVAQSTVNRQNNQLQGWSWIAGTFSWVEPTAWALLALRKRAAGGQAIARTRIDEAASLLIDRCCEQGGWNYGNSNMMGKELRPYVPTTSIALLALQHLPAAAPAVSKSLRYLEGAAVSERSAVPLSIATIALEAHGRAAAAPREALSLQAARTIELGNHLGMAMALCTLFDKEADAPFLL
jgi:hypothetical protein